MRFRTILSLAFLSSSAWAQDSQPTSAPVEPTSAPTTAPTSAPTPAVQPTPEPPKPNLDAGIGPYGAGFSTMRPISGQFNVSFGGHVKLDLIFDSQQTNSDLPFFAETQQLVQVGDGGADDALIENPKANNGGLNLAARELLLRMGFGGPKQGDWSSSGYIEFNFLGFLDGANAGAPTPILRHGYATLSNAKTKTSFLFGQAEGPFSPIDPQTVNWETLVLIGNPLSRLPQIRATKSFGQLKLEGALVRPADLLNDGKRGFDVQGRGQDSLLPEIQGRVSYTLPGAKTGHYWFFRVPGSVGLSGRFARERFHAGTAEQADTTSSTVALDFVLPAGPLTFQGEAYYGANTDNVFGLAGVLGSNNANGLFIPERPIKELGGWLQLGVNATEKIYSSLSYGASKPEEAAFTDTAKVEDSGLNITFNSAITANVFYRILSSNFVALEYTGLSTKAVAPMTVGGVTSFQDLEGFLHRVQLGFLFTF